MASPREGVASTAAHEPAVVAGEVQRNGVGDDRGAGQRLLPGQRAGGRGADARREPSGCKAEDECVVEGRAGVMDDNLPLADYIMKNLKSIEQEIKEIEKHKQMKAKQQQTSEAKFISRKNLANRWGVSTITIRRMEYSGMLKTYRFFRDARYALSNIEEIERNALEKK